MKKNPVLYLLIGLLTVGAARPVQAQQKVVAEQIVAVVGGSMILLSEVEQAAKQLAEDRKQQGYTSDKDPQCEALEYLMMQKLLANQAQLDSLKYNEGRLIGAVEDRVIQLTEEMGSVRALEAFYKKPIFQIKDDLKNQYMDMQLAQMMESTIRERVTIIPSEVEKFYRNASRDSLPMVPEQYIYAQIVMFPPSMEAAKLRAREQLLEIRQNIINGKSFSSQAILYSVDGSASRGGELDAQPKQGFVKPFADALDKLKPGQVSDVVETEFGFHIIQLIDRKGDVVRARHILIRPTFTTDELAVSENKLDSIAREIRDGKISFADAALKFSQDDYSKYNGGVVTNHEMIEYYGESAKRTSTRFTRQELGPDYLMIRDLKPGDVSESISTQDMKGNEVTKIVQLQEVIPTHRANIKEDYLAIEELALAQKQSKVYNEWLKKKMAAMYIKIDPRFTSCEFDNPGWIK